MTATAALRRPGPTEDVPEATPADASAGAPPPDPRFAREVAEGLARAPRTVPSRWLYDAAGSALFEAITALEEYYPTRAEARILEAHAPAMLDGAGAGAVVVEYGAGASVKTRRVVDAADRPALYVSLDVSDAFDAEVDRALSERCPGLEVRRVAGDFLDPHRLPIGDAPGTRVGLFLGSTIGNLEDAEIVGFLAEARDALGAGARLIVGVDVKKDRATLEAAYDDAAGVTARFDLNLLARMNRELGADFDLRAFRHEARWNEAESRVEMHLVSARAQRVRVGGEVYRFAPGESIRSEISRKFGPEDLPNLARGAGWTAAGRWTDPAGLFSVVRLDAR